MMNPIAKRRLLIVAAVAAVLVSSTGGLYVWRKQRIETHYQHLRVEGMAAAAKDDYKTATADLQQYLARNNNDVEALREYCRVRPKVPSPDRSHLRETMTALRYLVSLRPDFVEERRELLKLYLTYNLNTEALDTAERLLPADPQNVELISAKAQALARLRRSNEALQAAQQWASLVPHDAEAQRLRIALLKSANVSDADILSDVDGLVKQFPDSQGILTLRGQALLQASKIEEAREAFKAAAAKPAGSPQDVRALAEMMDRVGLFDDSLKLLLRLAETDGTDESYIWLGRRLWERGEITQFLALAEQHPTAFEGHPELVAIWGMSLRNTGRIEEGEAKLAKLDRSEHDATAKAWSAVVRGLGATATVERSKELIDLVNDALIDRPGDAYLLYFLGEAYAQAGDYDLAVGAWQRSSRGAPAWAFPLMRASEVLAMQNRHAEAFNLAQSAAARSQRLALPNFLRVWTAAVDAGQRADGAELLRVLEDVSAQAPGEVWLRAARATILCRLNRTEDAKALIAQDLASGTKLDQDTLLRFATISRVHKLGLDEQISGRIAGDVGITAETAATQFFQLFLDKGRDAALAAFEQMRVASGKSDERAWLLAAARVRDFVRDEKAVDAWRAVIAAHGSDVEVIQSGLASTSLWTDRATVDVLIERLRQLMGDRGVNWRLHRARWLIEGSTDDAPNKEATQKAADLLTEVLAVTPDAFVARYWQARCQVRLGNPSSAIDHMMVATRVNPRSTPLALYTAQLLQRQGDLVRAREQLDRLSSADLTDPEQNALAAGLLANQGNAQKAIELLEQTRALRVADDSDLLLATLYQRQGQYEKAEAIVTRLLQKPTPLGVAFAADFYRSRGRLELAQQTLEKLYSLELKPGVREMTIADFEMRRGDMAQAAKFAEAATVADPRNIVAWRLLLMAKLSARDFEGASATLESASRVLGSDPYLADVRAADTWNLIKLARNETLRPLALKLLDDPKDEAARQALILFARLDGKPVDSAAVEQLRQLSDRFPRSLPLQVVTAQTLLEMGRFEDAATIATRGAQSFPTDGNLPRLAAQALLNLGNWSEARAFATSWRQQAGGDVVAPDLLAAIAALEQGDAAESERLLRPHLQYAMDRLQQHSDLIRTFLVALYSTGKSSEAELLVTQTIQRRPMFVREWLDVIGTKLTTPDVLAWLRRLEGQLSDPQGQAHLARVWLQLSLRPDAPPEAAQEVRQRVVSLESVATLDSHTLTSLGVIADQIGDDERAERLYRRAAADGASVPVVWNNLAMLLLDGKRQLDEAESLAAKAAESKPPLPVFGDTYAQVLLANGKVALARAAVDRSLALDPQNAVWRLTDAEIAAAEGNADKASATLSEITDQATLRAMLGKDELRRVEALRGRLAKNSVSRS